MIPPCYRPIVQTMTPKPPGAMDLAGGPHWFEWVAVHAFGEPEHLVRPAAMPRKALERFIHPRAPIAGISLHRPRLMGILNVTPDSFSDGGVHADRADALVHALRMAGEGADLIDIGGESTRPGADIVTAQAEMDRVVPVISDLRANAPHLRISVDTRKAAVARAARQAGADIFNDVSALTFDTSSLAFAAGSGMPVCLMHARGDPKTMQQAPHYDDVLIEVIHDLEEKVAVAERAGIARTRILIDPGIGFGKTLEHNLILLRNISAFHQLGCPILLGVSRKRFIGTLGDEPDAARRAPGSIAVALEALRQGVQMLRVHDVRETRQAVSLWEALNGFSPEA
jgi:dihydropteroate synthase